MDLDCRSASPCRAVRRLAGGAFMLLTSACQPPPTPGWSGYLEGDYVYIAAPVAGTLNRLQV
jgi:hypothetical protein